MISKNKGRERIRKKKGRNGYACDDEKKIDFVNAMGLSLEF